MACIEDKVISAKRSNTLDSLNIDSCQTEKIIERKLVEPSQNIFKAYNLFKDQTNYSMPDFNISIE